VGFFNPTFNTPPIDHSEEEIGPLERIELYWGEFLDFVELVSANLKPEDKQL
jgi:hypothetical protein